MSSPIWITFAREKFQNVPKALSGSACFTWEIEAPYNIYSRSRNLTRLVKSKLSSAVVRENDRELTVQWTINNDVVPPQLDAQLKGKPLKELCNILEENQFKFYANFYKAGFNEFPFCRVEGFLREKAHSQKGSFISEGNNLERFLSWEEYHATVKVAEAEAAAEEEPEVDENVDKKVKLDLASKWANWMDLYEKWDIQMGVEIGAKEDLRIVTGDGSVEYHRILMEGVCPLIDRLLSGGKVINMPDVNCEGVRLLMEWLDRKSIANASASAAICGLQVAHFYEVAELLKDVTVLLVHMPREEIKKTEAKLLYKFARDKRGMDDLVEKSLDVIRG